MADRLLNDAQKADTIRELLRQNKGLTPAAAQTWLEEYAELLAQRDRASRTRAAMADETKGEGMTLKQVRDDLRREAKAQRAHYIGSGDWFDQRADAIDAHLAAQSAMRVDETMVERSEDWILAHQWSGRTARETAREILQAAIGGKE